MRPLRILALIAAAVLVVACTSSPTEATGTSAASTSTTTTQQAVEDPTAIETESANEDVVADDPVVVMLAEKRALLKAAGPGRIFGQVVLSEEARTWPPAESQPMCVGAGDFDDITPGVIVMVHAAETPEAPYSTILHGSLYDGALGCFMWFGLDVAEDDNYTIMIGHHRADIDTTQLDANGWVVYLWSSSQKLAAFCEEDEELIDAACRGSAILE